MTAEEEQIKILTNSNRVKTGALPPMAWMTKEMPASPASIDDY